MAIVQFPVGRLGNPDRVALRQGLAWPGPRVPSLRLLQKGQAAPAHCAACAAPIDCGAVWRGDEAFCSVECSLGCDRPA
jgi:hypothetical protein